MSQTSLIDVHLIHSFRALLERVIGMIGLLDLSGKAGFVWLVAAQLLVIMHCCSYQFLETHSPQFIVVQCSDSLIPSTG
jgi:hypothetical protein